MYVHGSSCPTALFQQCKAHMYPCETVIAWQAPWPHTLSSAESHIKSTVPRGPSFHGSYSPLISSLNLIQYLTSWSITSYILLNWASSKELTTMSNVFLKYIIPMSWNSHTFLLFKQHIWLIISMNMVIAVVLPERDSFASSLRLKAFLSSALRSSTK